MQPEKQQEPIPAPRHWNRDDFKAPPVVRRRFLVRLDITKEDFEQRANSLIDAMQKDLNEMAAERDRLKAAAEAAKP